MRKKSINRANQALRYRPGSSAALLETLEPRVLFSALPAALSFDPDGLPQLHSNPDAPVAIHLDFRYESIDGTKLRFNPSGSPTTFDALEQDLIYTAWAKVAANYAPFDINITTVTPDPSQPFILAAIYRLPTGPGSGGGAGSDGFIPLAQYAHPSVDRIDFSKGRVGDGMMAQSWIREGAIWGADVITHETGHSQWISGHETADTESNRIGIQTMPIVAGPFTRSSGPHGAWYNWYTEYIWPENPDGFFFIQDDVAKIARGIVDSVTTWVDPNYTGDGMRPDDHGNTAGAATAMTYDTGSSSFISIGVIERLDDVDVLSFTWAGGTAWIGISTAQPNSLLDARFTVRDFAGNVIGVSDQADSEQSALRLNSLAAGTYFIEVASDGDYSELGLYEAVVSTAEPQTFKRLSHLPMNGNSLADSSGQGHNGTWIGGAQWTTGPDGSMAARFNGTNRIEINNPASLASETNFTHVNENLMGRTIAFWFKADSTTGTRVLFEDPLNSSGYQIYLQNGQLVAKAQNSGGLSNWESATTLTAPGTISTGQWYHVAFTHEFTFSLNPDTIKLYLGGVEVASGDGAVVPNTNVFRVGSTSFVGAIDDVHILSDVPPAHLIAEWAGNADQSQFAPTGMLINLNATVTHDAASLSWDAVGGASGYRILRSEDNQNFRLIATVDASTTDFIDAGLLGSHSYFYAVDAQGADGVGKAQVLTRAGAIRYAQYTKIRNPDPDDFWATKMDLWGHGVDGLYAIALGFFESDGHRDTDVLIERSTDGVNFTEVITLPATESVYYDNGPAHNGLVHGETYTYRLTPIDDLGPVTTAAIILETEPLTFIPVAVDDSAVGSGAPVVLNVLSNDTDFDGDTLSVSAVTQGQYGSVTINANGTVTYRVITGGGLTDTFTYTADDGFGGTSVATVTVDLMQSPYPSTIPNVRTQPRIEAEDFDLGGEGVAYHDTTNTNLHGVYRAGSEDVDIRGTWDAGIAYAVTDTANGEYLEYTFDLPTGFYNLHARISAADGASVNPGDIRVRIGHSPLGNTFTELGVLSVPDTGSSLSWQTLSLNNLDLTAFAGQGKVLRLEMIGGDFNLNWIEFETINAAPAIVNPILDFSVDQAAAQTPGSIDLNNVFEDETALSYLVIGNTNPATVGTQIMGGNLKLNYHPAAPGQTTVTLRATDTTGLYTLHAFTVTVLPGFTPGDTDGDGDIDDADLGTAFSNYTGPVGAAGGKTPAHGDTDSDGDVDDVDLGTTFSSYTGPLAPAAAGSTPAMLHKSSQSRSATAWTAQDRAAAWRFYQASLAVTKPAPSAFSLFQLDESTSTGFDALSVRILGETAATSE